MRLFGLLSWAAAAGVVALLGAVGHQPKRYGYRARHALDVACDTREKAIAALRERVRGVGVQQPSVLLPEEPTVSLSTSGVRALGQLVARQAAKSTEAVTTK